MKITDILNSNKIKCVGRTYLKDDKLYMNFSGSGIKFNILSDKLIVKLTGTKVDDVNGRPYVCVLVDNERYDYAIDNLDYVIILDLPYGKHNVQILKRTETSVSHCAITEIEFIELVDYEQEDKLKIEFYGDSLTCGFGNLSECADDPFKTSTESFLEGYAYLTAKALNAEYSAISVSGFPVYKSRWNEGFPIDSVADMISISDYSEDMTFDTVVPWDNTKYKPDLVVVNLGANDHSYFTEGMNWVDELIKKHGDFSSCVNDEKYIQEINNLKNRINKLLDDLRNLYGKDLKIVWCLFDIYFEDGVLYNTIKEQVLSYDGNTHFCDVSFKTNVRGAAWHPGKVMHEEAAGLLIDCIKKII